MLSRNNIRIKVLQALYAHEMNPMDTIAAEKFLMKSINNSYKLYLLTMLYLQKVASYSLKDFEIKAKKYVPSEDDKKVSLKLYENPVIKALRDNDVFQKILKKEGIIQLIDDDLVRQLYKTFIESDYYETYRTTVSTPLREHQYAIVRLYMTMRESEVFDEYLFDHFPTWDDDESLVYGAVKRSVRELPQNDQFFVEQLPNSEFVDELGKDLIYRVLRNDEELQAMVAARLKNWQEDRVALLDMLMMKMAICEFLYFDSIPTKVTINEYVNVAKLYSTDKSKRFINGILDRLMQELMEEGRIQKSGRGLIDE
jgi:N utilization substance protein B